MTTYVISSNPVHPEARGVVRSAPAAATPQATRNRYLIPPRLLVALLALATLSVLMTSVQADQPLAVVSYTVEAGDTLWSISEERTPVGGDVRETIAAVRGLNDLHATVIHPGQVLQLPEG